MSKPTIVTCLKCQQVCEVYTRVNRRAYKCLDCIRKQAEVTGNLKGSRVREKTPERRRG